MNSRTGADFEKAIRELDAALYSVIPSQTSEEDKESLLTIQNAVRNSKDKYVYLEIGSHLGGSIQPYLLDPKCEKIYSIDTRPETQPDERYPEGYKCGQNTTQRMLDNLEKVSARALGKIVVFEDDAANIGRAKINPKADVCFIDGEHTNVRVFSDFNFCRSVLNEDGVIVFHDSDIVFEGIQAILKGLKRERAGFNAYFLSGSVFVVSFGGSGVDKREEVRALRRRTFRANIWKRLLLSVFPNVGTRRRLARFRRWLSGASRKQ